jgi:serine protease
LQVKAAGVPLAVQHGPSRAEVGVERMRVAESVVRSSLRACALALTASLALGGLLPARAEPPAAKPLARAPAGRPADGLIVKLKDVPSREAAQALGANASRADRLQRVLRESAMAVTRTRPTGLAAHRIDFGRVLGHDEAERLAEQLRARPDVEWAVPNTRERRLDVVPNDPFYQAGDQWWLQQVRGSNQNALADRLRGVPGFAAAWSLSTGSPAAVVAVLDTGITSDPELAGHILPGYDFVSTLEYANDGDGRDNDPSDPGDWVTQAEVDTNPSLFGGCTVENSSWHGTNIAGLIAAATNELPPRGVAAINWDARVLPVRVAGKCGADVADIVDGMYYAAGIHRDGVPDNKNPARIINISFGGSEPCNEAYQSAIADLANVGAVVIAAAGNERGAVTRPASCRGAIAVGAVNRDGFKSNYSNFGSAVSLMTVGGDPPEDGLWGSILGDTGLLTVDNGGTTGPGAPGYARLFGSSFSTPLVSGTISLMLSVNPNLSAAQIIAGLKASARPHVTSRLMGVCTASNPGRCICSTATCGAGLLDAPQALLYAQNPGAYVAPAQQAALIDSDDVSRAVALGPDQGAGAPPPPQPSSGGGALDPGWLRALALAVLAVRAARVPRRAAR